MSFRWMRPNVLITSGGTTEYIDNVRVMSNVSTGKTGARIAEVFLNNGWNVQYVHGVGAEMPRTGHPNIQFAGSQLETYEVVTAKDAEARIKCCAGDADAIIMAMAVSDFTFNLEKDVKLDSSDAEGFIKFLGETIEKNVKILPQLRTWNPKAFIVGFKYTVGASTEEQEKIARNQCDSAKIDMTFVNDDVRMKQLGTHAGRFVNGNHISNEYTGKEYIAGEMFRRVNGTINTRMKDFVDEFTRRDYDNPFDSF